MSWIKIDNRVFEVDSVDIQLSIGSHSNLNIRLNLEKNPKYYDFFIKKYEMQSSGLVTLNKSVKFDLIHKNFIAKGCITKTIDIVFDKQMNISLICDYLDQTDTQERREELINELLNNNEYEK